ncbi:MAG: DUF4126 domain-containing protein [Oscillochloris sp.]|nr:DUF4126 domain-containing protein [Oscillochloris sp.]
MGTLIAFASALGLSTAAGLNAYLPLLTIGIFARMGWIQLAEPLDLIAHPLVLLIIAALAVLDFVGDKVPTVDSALHAAGMIISPIAGAIVALAAQGDLAQINPVLLAGAGIVAAGSMQFTRSAIRPVITAATGGTGNPVISLAEDGAAFVISVLAILVPVLAIILIAVLAFVLFRSFRGAWNTWRERRNRANVYSNGNGKH